MTYERTETRELGEAPESRRESLTPSSPNRRKGSGWLRRLLAHLLICAAVGTILGAIIGAASYTPDQTGLVFFSQGEMTAFGAFAGFMLGVLAGILLWLARTLIRRFVG